MQIFQRLGIFEQYPHLSAPTGAHHDCHRRGQSQGAGAGNYQYGNGIGQAEFQRIAQQHPHRKGYRRNRHHNGNEHPGDFVRQSGNGSLGTSGLLHHADDLSQGGVLSHLVGPEFQITLSIHRGGGYPVAHSLFHRDTFPGQGALINGGPPLDDGSVHGNAPAGADNHRVSHLHLLHWNVLNRISPADRCGFGTQIHQSPDGIAGFSLGPGFQVFSQGDQSENHGGGLKIEVLAVLCDDIPFPMPHGPGHTEQSGYAVNQCGQASHGNQ